MLGDVQQAAYFELEHLPRQTLSRCTIYNTPALPSLMLDHLWAYKRSEQMECVRTYSELTRKLETQRAPD